MERYIRKYGDAVFIEELVKLSELHTSSRQELAENYIKNEGERLLNVVDRLGGA